MTTLLNYHIGRIVLGSMRVGVSVWLGWSEFNWFYLVYMPSPFF